MPRPTPLTPPKLADDPPLFVVLNPGSGRGDAQAQRRQIEAACRAAGRHCAVLVPGRNRSPQELARRAVREAQSAGGIAVAAGGDGTVNAVGQAALAAGVAFAVLPLGTFNYFGRAHGVPTELDAALAALLATPHARPVQAGLVNGRAFFVNASIGWYARSLRDREAYKHRFGRSRLVAMGAALATLLQGARRWVLEIDTDGAAPRVLHTPTLFVGNNALQLAQVGVDSADAVARGDGLGAIALAPRGRIGMLALALRAAWGRLGSGPAVTSFSFHALRIQPLAGTRSGRVRVALDGETTWMGMPIAFRTAPQPLWLVASAAPPAATAG